MEQELTFIFSSLFVHGPKEKLQSSANKTFANEIFGIMGIFLSPLNPIPTPAQPTNLMTKTVMRFSLFQAFWVIFLSVGKTNKFIRQSLRLRQGVKEHKKNMRI